MSNSHDTRPWYVQDWWMLVLAPIIFLWLVAVIFFGIQLLAFHNEEYGPIFAITLYGGLGVASVVFFIAILVFGM